MIEINISKGAIATYVLFVAISIAGLVVAAIALYRTGDIQSSSPATSALPPAQAGQAFQEILGMTNITTITRFVAIGQATAGAFPSDYFVVFVPPSNTVVYRLSGIIVRNKGPDSNYFSYGVSASGGASVIGCALVPANSFVNMTDGDVMLYGGTNFVCWCKTTDFDITYTQISATAKNAADLRFVSGDSVSNTFSNLTPVVFPSADTPSNNLISVFYPFVSMSSSGGKPNIVYANASRASVAVTLSVYINDSPEDSPFFRVVVPAPTDPYQVVIYNDFNFISLAAIEKITFDTSANTDQSMFFSVVQFTDTSSL